MSDVNVTNEVKVPVNYFDEMQHLGKAHKHFLWIAAMCYFFDMMNMNIFAYIAAPVQKQLGLTLKQMGTLNSLGFYGMFFGGIFAGWLADKIGRKKTILSCITIFSIASIINAFVTNFWLFGICRFVAGFAVVGMSIVAMVYITEMMPSHNRGKYQGLTIASGTIAVPLAAFLTAYLMRLSTANWWIMFVISGLGLLLVPLGMYWFKESPRWLVGKGRIAEAEAIVGECVGYAVDLSAQAAAGKNSKVTMMETIKFLFSNGQIKMTLVLSFMAIGVVTGGMYLSNWNFNLLVNMGLPLASLLAVGALSSFAAPLGDFFSSFISDRGGRKTPIVILCFTVFIVCFIKGLWVSLLGVGVTMFFKAALACCTATIFWTYLAENLPNRFRSTGTGLIMSLSRLVVAFLTPTVPIIFAAYGWLGVNFVNGLLYLIPGIIALVFGGKTAKKTLEQIEAEVRSSYNQAGSVNLKKAN